jgi:hypothetical protein
MKAAAENTVKHQHMLKRTVRFGQSTSFLCSAPLRSKNRSDEHVFPKWLQNRFKLWNQRLDLINLTSIPYRQLTIPCCKTCNNVHLSRMEDIIRAAVESGPNAVAQLPPSTVYMWLSKIFYGVLESLLRADRRGSKRPIVPKEALRELRLHHDFMQGIRRSLEFPVGIPGSIFIFGTTQPDRVEAQFDFLNNHHNLKDRLHPMQFREATAEVFYKSILLESAPFYTVLEDRLKMLVMTQNSRGVSFREWDWLVFCEMLAFYWDQPVEEIYGGNIGWASSIRDEQKQFRKLDPNTYYRFLVPDQWKQAQDLPRS